MIVVDNIHHNKVHSTFDDNEDIPMVKASYITPLVTNRIRDID